MINNQQDEVGVGVGEKTRENGGTRWTRSPQHRPPFNGQRQRFSNGILHCDALADLDTWNYVISKIGGDKVREDRLGIRFEHHVSCAPIAPSSMLSSK